MTRLAGPRTYYIEGTFVHARLEPAGPAADGIPPQTWGPGEVGGRARWGEVREGEWHLVGSTRVCNANCGDVSAPADTCALDLDVTADTTVVVTCR